MRFKRCELHKAYKNFKKDASLSDKVLAYNALTTEALKHTDLVVRLEDYYYEPENAIRKILDFAEVKDDPLNYKHFILKEPPISIG